MGAKGIVVVVLAAAVLAAPGDAPAGGIDDQPCPNVAGENTNTCPVGTVGTPYTIRFVERAGSGCGPGQQTFHLDSGIAPPGLTLARDGTLSGTPVQAGRFRFYVEMREPKDTASCAGKETQKQFTLVVRQPVSVEPAPPLRTEVGARVDAELRARGGTGVHAWRLVDGTLPPGVRLERRGALTGLARTAGTYSFAATVTDTEKRSARWTGTFSVAPRLHIQTERLPAGRVGRSFRAALRAAGGVGRRSWRIRAGRLPRGLRVDEAGGRLVGTPAAAGTYRVTVAVRDALRVTAATRLVLVVHAARRPRPRARTRAVDYSATRRALALAAGTAR